MAKNIIIIVLIILAIVLIYQFFLNRPQLKTKKVNIKGSEFNLEIAQTIPQKTLGLGKRESLCNNCGMLFVWDLEFPLSFWMKDTLIPLDIIFLNKNGVVLNYHVAQPEPGVSDFDLKKYSSLGPAKYVIELNAGIASKLNIIPGDLIQIPN